MKLKYLISQPLSHLIFLLWYVVSWWWWISTLVKQLDFDLRKTCSWSEKSLELALNSPKVLLESVDKQLSRVLNLLLKSLTDTITSLLTLIQQTIIGLLEKYIRTFICLLNLIISLVLGTLNMVTQDTIQTVNYVIQQVVQELDQGLKSISDWIQSQGVNSLNNVVGSLGIGWSLNQTTLDLPQVRQGLSGLATLLMIPSSLPATLHTIPKPDLNTWLTTVEGDIVKGFDWIRHELNKTVQVNLPPLQVHLDDVNLDYCPGMDLSWLQEVENALLLPLKVMVAMLTLSMFACCFISYKYQSKVENSTSSPSKFPRLQLYLSSVGTTSWCLLFTALSGIVMISIQQTTLESVLLNFQPPWNATLQPLYESWQTNVQDRAYDFQTSINQQITLTESNINNLVSSWLSSSVSTLNTTLIQTVDTLSTFLDSTFAPVPLIQTSFLEFLSCMGISGWVLGLNIPKISLWRMDLTEIFSWFPSMSLSTSPLNYLLSSYKNRLEQDKVYYYILLALGLITPIYSILVVFRYKPPPRDPLLPELPPSPVYLKYIGTKS